VPTAVMKQIGIDIDTLPEVNQNKYIIISVSGQKLKLFKIKLLKLLLDFYLNLFVDIPACQYK
jgi:hypothetical protein